MNRFAWKTCIRKTREHQYSHKHTHEVQRDQMGGTQNRMEVATGEDAAPSLSSLSVATDF